MGQARKVRRSLWFPDVFKAPPRPSPKENGPDSPPDPPAFRGAVGTKTIRLKQSRCQASRCPPSEDHLQAWALQQDSNLHFCTASVCSRTLALPRRLEEESEGPGLSRFQSMRVPHPCPLGQNNGPWPS